MVNDSESRSEVTPELEQQARSVLNQWQAASLSYQDASETLSQMRDAAVNRPADEGYIEIIMGIMQGYRGNLNASIQHFEHARDLMMRVGNRHQTIRCTLNIGETYRLKGNFTRARQYFKAAYDSASELGLRHIQLVARTNEGQMLVSMGHYDQASTVLLEAYRMSHVLSQSEEAALSDHAWRDSTCEICHALAQIHLQNGDMEAGWRYASEALEIANALQVPMWLGYANRIMGEVLTARTSTYTADYEDEIDACFTKAISAFRETKLDGESARTMFAHGNSLGKRGKNGLGARKLQQAMVVFTKLGMVDDAAKAAEAQLKLL